MERDRRSSMLVLLAVSFAMISPARGQLLREHSGISRIQQVYVPADEPEAWPEGDWTAVATEELLGLLESSESSVAPESAFLETAVYSARLSGTSLVDGQLEAVSRLRSDRPTFLDLGTPSLSVTRLDWSSQPADWGLSPDGRSLLLVRADREELTGRWSLKGHAMHSSIQFDISVPPAVSSTLKLDVPVSFALRVGAGLIAIPDGEPRPGWRTWSIDLGRRTSCELSVSNSGSDSPKGLPRLTVSQVADYAFLGDILRFQADVTIHDVAGDFPVLEFDIPPGVQVTSVSTGVDSVLSFQRSQQENSSTVRVDVSSFTLIQGMSIRIRGKRPARLGTPQSLPRVELRQAQWMKVRRQLVVSRPLQLKDVVATGTQLVEASVTPNAGASLVYEDFDEASRLSATVDTPEPDLTANVLAEADWHRNDPLLRSVIRFEANSGATFLLECHVPFGWEVTRVESDATIPVAQWSTSRDAENKRARLQIELSSPLTQQKPVELVVWSRPTDTVRGPSVEVPSILPIVSDAVTVTLAITPPRGILLQPPPDSTYRSVELPASLAQHPVFDHQNAEGFDQRRLVLQSTDPRAPEQLLVSNATGESQSVPEPPVERERAVDSINGPGTSPVHPAELSPLWIPVRLKTVVAVDSGSLCRNQAVLQFPELSRARQIRIKLPETARLISVDGPHHASIEENDLVVTLLPASVPEPLVILYDSPLNLTLLTGEARVPLPSWPGGATTIGWEISLPGGYRLRSETDGATATGDPRVSWSQRILGPLGRSSTSAIFWPFSAQSWSFLLSENQQQRPPEISRRSALGGGDFLYLSYWDTTVARRIGLLTFLISLILAAWPFEKERRISLVWTGKLVILGLAGAMIAPEFLAIPWGGFVTGSAMGAILPSWIRRPAGSVRRIRQPLKRTRLVRPMSTTAGVIGLMLVTVSQGLGWQSTIPATSSPDSLPSPSAFRVLIPLRGDDGRNEEPDFVYVERSAILALYRPTTGRRPDYLIRSATYEVRDFAGPRLSLNAVFDVVLMRSDVPTHVVLELTDVLLRDSDGGTVAGEPATLIPRSNGEGIIVVVPPQSKDTEGGDGPIAVRVELECQPRPADQPDTPRLQIGIPPVVNSRVVFRAGGPQRPRIRVAHAGAAALPTADGRWRVDVGPVGHLTAHPEDVGESNALVPSEFASVIEVHPLRLQVESQLRFKTRSSWLRLGMVPLLLELPGRSVVRSVRSPGLSKSSLSPGESSTSLGLLFHEFFEDEVVVSLSYDVPLAEAASETVTIPPLAFLPADSPMQTPVHYIGIAASPGFRMPARDPEGMMPGTTGIDESRLPAWRGARKSRTAEATYQLDTARPLQIPLAVVASDRSGSLQQTITVSEPRVEWQAEWDVEVRELAAVAHRLQVDPRLDIREVRAVHGDVDRLASWSHSSPTEVVLILTEELSGRLTFAMSGKLQAENPKEFLFPRCGLPDAAEPVKERVTIRKSGGIALTIRDSDGEILSPERRSGHSENETEEVATLVMNAGDPEPLLQVSADAPVALERLSIVRPEAGGVTPFVIHHRLAIPSGVPGNVDVQVSSGAESPRLTATVPVAQSNETTPGGTWVLERDGVDAEVIDVTLSGTLAADHQRLPEVSFSGAVLKRHVVVLADSAQQRDGAAAGEIIAPEDLPLWMRTRLKQAGLANQLAIEIGGPVAVVASAELAPSAGSISRLDTGIWAERGGGWRGVTTATFYGARDTEASFLVPQEIEISEVQVNNEEQKVESTGGRLDLSLSSTQRPHNVVIWWRLRASTVDGVPLLIPEIRDGAPHRVILFGDRDQYYLFGPQLEQIDPALVAADQASGVTGAADSPLATALKDSGLLNGEGAQESADTGRILAFRAAPDVNRLPLQVVDDDLLAILRLLVAAGILLLSWFIIGRAAHRVVAASRGGAQWIAMLVASIIIWGFGASIAGLLMLVVLSGLGLSRWRDGLRRHQTGAWTVAR